MQTKRKLFITMISVSFVLLLVVAAIAMVFAMSQQTITTTLNITYKAQDIDGTASATYTLGGVTKKLTAMKGGTVLGDTLVFHARDTENAGSLEFPEDALDLTNENDNVVIKYTYSNNGDKHYIASLEFDSVLNQDNMKVEYSIDGITYSSKKYAVVVPGKTESKSYWIKMSIENKAKNASFKGDFNWLLEGCNLQTEEYLALETFDMIADEATNTYTVKYVGGYLREGKLIVPSEVNGSPVTTIASNASLTQEQKEYVKNVFIPDSVTKIEMEAFKNFSELTSVTFENKVGWFADSIVINESDLVEASNAATLLTTTYSANIWTRS